MVHIGVKKYLQAVPFVALALAIAGMFIARAMVSISMMVMVGYALLLTDPRKTIRNFINDKVLIAISLVFVVYLLSAINSTEDTYFLSERLRLKLPFLALPLAFTVFKNKITAK